MSEPAANRTNPAAVDEDALVEEARAARAHAYAPYSGFTVGAAVATDAGVFRGVNVENASYPVGTCAERVAAAAAVAGGASHIDAVAVAGPTADPTPPCGACRQFLNEFGSRMLVISEGSSGERRRWSLADLLPEAFGRDALHGS